VGGWRERVFLRTCLKNPYPPLSLSFSFLAGMRTGLHESEKFLALKEAGGLSKTPLTDAVTKYRTVCKHSFETLGFISMLIFVLEI
jgi:hypothetical protein